MNSAFRTEQVRDSRNYFALFPSAGMFRHISLETERGEDDTVPEHKHTLKDINAVSQFMFFHNYTCNFECVHTDKYDNLQCTMSTWRVYL